MNGQVPGREGETWSYRPGRMRTQSVPHPVTLLMFSHSLFPTCSCTAAEIPPDATARGDQQQGYGSTRAELRLGHQKRTISGAEVLEQGRLCVEELLGMAERRRPCPRQQAPSSATPNPPNGPAPCSPLEAMPLASACNISSGNT